MLNSPSSTDSVPQPRRAEGKGDLFASASALLQSLQSGDVFAINSLLEDIAKLTREKSWRSSSSESLAQTWSVCVSVLDVSVLEPELYARALQILRTLSGLFCHPCGVAHAIDPTTTIAEWRNEFDSHLAVINTIKVLERCSNVLNVQIAGCAFLSRLAGCGTCLSPNKNKNPLLEEELLDDVVEILLNIIRKQVLDMKSSPCPTMNPDTTTTSAANTEIVLCLLEALSALRYLANTPVARKSISTAQSKNGGSVFALIAAALAMCRNQWTVQQHGLVLLSSLSMHANHNNRATTKNDATIEMVSSKEHIIDIGMYYIEVATAAVQHQNQQRGSLDVLAPLLLCMSTLIESIDDDECSLYGPMVEQFLKSATSLMAAARSVVEKPNSEDENNKVVSVALSLRLIEACSVVSASIHGFDTSLLVDAVYVVSVLIGNNKTEDNDDDDYFTKRAGQTHAISIIPFAMHALWVVLHQPSVVDSMLSRSSSAAAASTPLMKNQPSILDCIIAQTTFLLDSLVTTPLPSPSSSMSMTVAPTALGSTLGSTLGSSSSAVYQSIVYGILCVLEITSASLASSTSPSLSQEGRGKALISSFSMKTLSNFLRRSCGHRPTMYDQAISSRVISFIDMSKAPSYAAAYSYECAFQRVGRYIFDALVDAKLINDSVDEYSCEGTSAVAAKGYAMIHIVAEAGEYDLLRFLISQYQHPPVVDVLKRTADGATALQIARNAMHDECAALLEDVTQSAAAERQEALLRELECGANNNNNGGGGALGTDGAGTHSPHAARKSKKKKSVTRSASFIAEQPDEKSLKVGSGDDMIIGGGTNDTDDGGRQQELSDSILLRKQEMDDEYDRALEQRRLELAQEQQCRLESEMQVDDTNDKKSDSSDVCPTTPAEHADHDHCGKRQNNSSGSESDQGPHQDVDTLAVPHENTTSSPEMHSPFLNDDDGEKKKNDPHGAAIDRSTNTNGYQHSLFGSPSLLGADFFDSTGDIGASPSLLDTSDLNSQGMDALVGRSFSVPNIDDDTMAHLQDALFMQQGQPSPSIDEKFIQKEEASLFAHLHKASSMPSSTSLLRHHHHDQHRAGGDFSLAVPPNDHHVVPQIHQSQMSCQSWLMTNNSLRHPSSPSLLIDSLISSDNNTTDGAEEEEDGDDDDSDECSVPTRHLWIGNLGTRVSRTVLKTLFEQHGIVDDVVTFPGRMYAFVNYRTTEEALAAFTVLQDQVVPDLTGDRRLLLKYRPAKKAAAHLRALGLIVDGEGGDILSSPSEAVNAATGLAGGFHGAGNGGGSSGNSTACGDLDRDGNCTEPSPRIWLGNIAPTATSKSLHVVLGRFGALTDAAVFPARIGPLGYAFVKFENVADAVRAFDTLNNTVVPPLSGSKQLKMRYKPATDGPGDRFDGIGGSKASSVPSRHLWIGNITQKPSEDLVVQLFARYGMVDSVRIFPAKAYAFVNFTEISAATRAVAEMEGVCIPVLTGVKPLVMRFQQEAMSMSNSVASLTGMNNNTATPPPPTTLATAAPSLAGVMHRTASDSSLAFAASLSAQPNDGVGTLSTQNSLHSATMNAFLAPNTAGVNALHRSMSVGGFLADTTTVANNNNTPSSINGLPPVVPQQRQQHYQHQQQGMMMQGMLGDGTPATAAVPNTTVANTNNSGMHSSASATQLYAVLNNLTALQRAHSATLPASNIAPTSTSSPQVPDLMQLNLNSTMNVPANNNAAHINSHFNDIARLTSMLAGQSLTTPKMNTTANALICPLSGQIMMDPVVAADGITYNRSAIMEWMAVNFTSPVLQTPLSHATLVPNAIVREAVVGYLRGQMTTTSSSVMGI